MEVSHQIHRIYTEAQDIARRAGKALGSAQLLLAMFTEESAPNQAHTVLTEHRLNEDAIIEAIRTLEPEPDDTMKVILQKTQMTALSCDAELVNSLHLLLAISQVSSSLAYRAMERIGVNIGALRVKVFSYVTGVLPRRFYQHAQLIEAPSGPLPTYDWRPIPETPAGSDRSLRLGRDGGLGWEEPPLVDAERPRRRPLFTTADREAATAKAIAALVAEAKRNRGNSASGSSTEKSAVDSGTTSRFALSEEAFPLLTSLGRNISVEAEAGRLDPVIGREDELEQILDILHKRRANNPCIIGEPGVGKTAVAEGVAQRIVRTTGPDDEVRTVVELNVPALVAGTQLRGAFSERMGELREEVRRAGHRVILFVDEIHTLLGAGAGTGPLDAANDLKSALARGEFPCIGATTAKEYRQHIESDPALERRFQPILVEEPSEDDAVLIVEGVLSRYAEHHRVSFDDGCVEAAVRLSARYITDRRLPDKALNLIDLAGARAARNGEPRVCGEDIARIVAKLSGVPMERVVVNETERLLGMQGYLEARLIGQPSPISRITSMIQRNSAGFRSHRPIGSFLLLGPTGVGKTETVRVLADFLFHDRDAVTRFDMSEYLESHAVSKLIGAAPGYVGHEEGGQLTEAVHRRPYQLVLFDEVEKASRDVLLILLQVLEEGRLTDGRGRKVDFRNTVIAMTSNLGAAAFEKRRSGVGFSTREESVTTRDRAELERAVLVEAKKAFVPELWNRIEEKLVYHPLDRDSVAKIARLLLRESADRLLSETGIRYEAGDDVVDYLIEHGGFDLRYGARPMRRTIQQEVEGVLSRLILSREASRGDRVQLSLRDGAIMTELA